MMERIMEDLLKVQRNVERTLAYMTLREKGKKVEEGYEYHFDADFPYVPAYLYDEPTDVKVMAIRATRRKNEDYPAVTLVVTPKDGGEEEDIPYSDVFAGYMTYILENIPK